MGDGGVGGKGERETKEDGEGKRRKREGDGEGDCLQKQVFRGSPPRSLRCLGLFNVPPFFFCVSRQIQVTWLPCLPCLPFLRTFSFRR